MQPVRVRRVRLLHHQFDLGCDVLPSICDDAFKHLALGPVMYSTGPHGLGLRGAVLRREVENNVVLHIDCRSKGGIAVPLLGVSRTILQGPLRLDLLKVLHQTRRLQRLCRCLA